MDNFDLTPDSKRYCKTLIYNCLDENSECINCKCVKFENDKFTKNYDYFDDNNIWDWCCGCKFMFVPKWADKRLTEDEFHHCGMCDGTGLMSHVLRHDIKFWKIMSDDNYKKYKYLKDFLKSTSKCTTCHGDQYETFGGIPCKECGLIGMAPWGG